MFDWRKETADPCNPHTRKLLQRALLSRRKTFYGRLVDFFVAACKGKSVLHLGFVEHSPEYINKVSWKHAAIASVASRLVGIDIAEDGVHAARKLGYESYVLDVTGSESLGETFDVVIAGDIIEHLMSLDSLYAFSKKHMDAKSKVFISTPNPTCALWIPDVVRGGTFVSNFEHTCWIAPSHVNEHAQRLGMELHRYHVILGGASLGPIGRRLKAFAFAAMPEFIASTNVYELSRAANHAPGSSEQQHS